MIDSNRLKHRIEELGFTHSQLAELVGVRQPSITRLISGGQSGSRHLHKIAQVLQTTPEYLTRQTDEVDPSVAPSGPQLSSDELGWLQKLRTLSAADRETIVNLTASLSRGAK